MLKEEGVILPRMERLILNAGISPMAIKQRSFKNFVKTRTEWRRKQRSVPWQLHSQMPRKISSTKVFVHHHQDVASKLLSVFLIPYCPNSSSSSKHTVSRSITLNQTTGELKEGGQESLEFHECERPYDYRFECISWDPHPDTDTIQARCSQLILIRFLWHRYHHHC